MQQSDLEFLHLVLRYKQKTMVCPERRRAATVCNEDASECVPRCVMTHQACRGTDEAQSDVLVCAIGTTQDNG